jgi:hypothetical protein
VPHVAGTIGDRDLEDGLCDIDGDPAIVRHDGLLSLPRQQRLWHIDADRVVRGVHLIIEADESRYG